MGRTMGGQAMCIEGVEIVVEVAPLGDDRRKAVCKRRGIPARRDETAQRARQGSPAA